MSVRAAVAEALDGADDWRAQTALALAAQVDETGSASAARELRAVMTALLEDEAAKGGDELDEFRRRRGARDAG